MNYHSKGIEIKIQLDKLNIEKHKLEKLIEEFHKKFTRMREIGIEEVIKKGLK